MEDLKHRIMCSPDEFDRFKEDDSFICLLCLGRFLSSVDFCLRSIIRKDGTRTTDANDLLLDSFLFACSVFYEGFQLAKKIGPYFKENANYQEVVRPFLRDRKINILIEKALKHVRNKFVFHYDISFMRQALEGFELSEITFLSESAGTPPSHRFELPYEVSLHYFLSLEEYCDPEKPEMERYAIIVNDTSLAMADFSTNMKSFLLSELIDRGFRIASDGQVY